jgi:hypothetical protein
MTDFDPHEFTENRRRQRQREKKKSQPGNTTPTPAAMQSAVAVNPRRPTWMWYPRIPAGMITIIGAKGGSCKGLTCASLAATVTTAGMWPDNTGPAAQGSVLWCEAEDPLPEVVVPRLIAAGADLSRITFASRDAFAAEKDLRKFIEANEIKLIVQSPMVSFLQLSDLSSELSVRDVLERSQASIEGTPCALVGIAHSNKKADLAAIERILGAVAFTNFVRSVLLSAPEDIEERTYRLVHAKHNLSPKADDLILRPVHIGEDYRDQYVKLEWSIPEVNCDADAMFDRRKQKANGHDRHLTAAQWLVSYLREHGESLRVQVINEGEKEGFTENALRQAQQRNPRISSRQDGWRGPYLWSYE